MTKQRQSSLYLYIASLLIVASAAVPLAETVFAKTIKAGKAAGQTNSSSQGKAISQKSTADQSNNPDFELQVEQREMLDGDGRSSTRLRRPGSATMDQMPQQAPSRFQGDARQDALQGGAGQNALQGGANSSSFKLNVDQFATPPLQAGVGQMAPLQGNVGQMAPLQGGITAVKMLADYRVELIVDKSFSMRMLDCPGGMSRWQWCGMQLENLSKQLTPFVPNGFTLTTFCRTFQVHENSRPKDVEHLFNYETLSLGTRLNAPLMDRLDNYFRNRQPGSKRLLIAVITDGVPTPRATEPDAVANTLISASRQLNDPDEVTVVFLQIGGADPKGRAFVSAMDNELMRHGAKYDIVKTVSFDQLERQGLVQCLINSIKDVARRSSSN